MNRIDRLFGILTLLQSRKHVPARKIAEKYNISLRTLYRDIKALCELGIPVSSDSHKGYFVVQGYFLPPVSFTTEKANALLLRESLVPAFADRSIMTNYSDALNKIKAVLRNNQKEKLDELKNNIKMQVPECVRNDYEYLSGIQNVIASRSIPAIEYKNSREEMSRRKIEAIGLVFYAFNWHLIAWCHNNDEYRDFRVSRIVEMNDAGDPFIKSDPISLNEYMHRLPVDY